MMLLIFLMVSYCSSFGFGFRGPHHPNSHVAHKHAQPQKDTSFTFNSDIIHDIEHLKEDLGPLAENMDLGNVADDQLDFVYFQVHDADNNSKLDGLEMLHALQHIFEEEEDDHDVGRGNESNEAESRLQYITEIIDNALSAHDLNGDGYLGYAEFKLSRSQGLL